MLISHKLKCVFVHIAKTGGSSIEKVLKREDPDIIDMKHKIRGRHMLLTDFKEVTGEDFEKSPYSGYFKFCFVRNPWDRLLSGYLMCVQFPLTSHEKFIGSHTFDEYITKSLFKDTLIGIRQYDYVYEGGKKVVDFIGRFENMDEDFRKVAEILKIPGGLAHINATIHKHYSSYYNETTKGIVAKEFKGCIESFGYKFEDNAATAGRNTTLEKEIDHYGRRFKAFVKERLPSFYNFLKKNKEFIDKKISK